MTTTITCPTCGRDLPDFAREKAGDAALGEHSKLLEDLRDKGRITHEQMLELEMAAGDVYAETENSIRARLQRLRPDLADLIDLATAGVDHDWQIWKQYGEPGFKPERTTQ